jgi:DNA (cytosine-5)-methyltransferase 1
VAQRRRRVFVVASARADFDPAAVLFEFDGLRRDIAPSRETGKKPTAGFVSSIAGSLDTECGGGKLTHQSVANGHLIGTITARMFSSLGARDVQSGAIMPVVSPALNTCSGSHHAPDTKAYVVEPIALQDITPREKAQNGRGWNDDGTAYTVDTHATQGVAQAIPIDTMNMTPGHSSGGLGFGQPGDPSFTLTKGHSHAVAQPVAFQDTADCLTAAYGTKWNGNASATNGSLFAAQPIGFDSYNNAVTGDVSKTLDVGQDYHHVPNVMVAQPIIGGVDYENNAHGPDDVTGPLLKGSPTGGGRPLPAVALHSMAVRRLTPVECERLQGFPDGYTNIPWRKKDESPDGPRYKALGNSWAVPVVQWIGHRIQQEINK